MLRVLTVVLALTVCDNVAALAEGRGGGGTGGANGGGRAAWAPSGRYSGGAELLLRRGGPGRFGGAPGGSRFGGMGRFGDGAPPSGYRQPQHPPTYGEGSPSRFGGPPPVEGWRDRIPGGWPGRDRPPRSPRPEPGPPTRFVDLPPHRTPGWGRPPRYPRPEPGPPPPVLANVPQRPRTPRGKPPVVVARPQPVSPLVVVQIAPQRHRGPGQSQSIVQTAPAPKPSRVVAAPAHLPPPSFKPVYQQALPQVLASRPPAPPSAPPSTKAPVTVPPARPPLGAALAATPPVPDEVLFELGPNIAPSALAPIEQRYGLRVLRFDRITLLDTTLYRLQVLGQGRSLPDVLRALRADGRLAAVQVNNHYTLQDDKPASVAPAAPSLQWAADKMQLAAAHKISQGGDVLVAMLDSGVDDSHPEIAGAKVTLVDLIDAPFKPNVHGTAMAGALLAHARLLGVSPGVHILEIRAFEATAIEAGAEGTTEHIARGLEAAYVERAHIVNLSFAGPADHLLARMLAALRQRGLTVVAAAGNGGAQSPPLFPGADPNVIAVTATDQTDALYTDATRGPYIRIAAPGVDILEPAPGGAYQLTSGTSVAAAHVSGIVALMLARNFKLDPAAVQHMLSDTASTLPQTADAGAFSPPGLVNAFGALQVVDRRPDGGTAPEATTTH